MFNYSELIKIEKIDSKANNLWFDIQQEIIQHNNLKDSTSINAKVVEILTNQKHNILRLFLNFDNQTQKDLFIVKLLQLKGKYFSFDINYFNEADKTISENEIPSIMNNKLLSIVLKDIKEI